MVERRTAIVTGSGKRVGREIAQALLDDGWDVVGHVHHDGDDPPAPLLRLDRRGALPLTTHHTPKSKPQITQTLFLMIATELFCFESVQLVLMSGISVQST